MRSWSGLSVSSARDGHAWNTRVFICPAQTAAAGSSITSIGCARALGNVTTTERIHSGAPFGGFFEKKNSPSTSPPKRCSATARSPFASTKAVPTAAR